MSSIRLRGSLACLLKIRSYLLLVYLFLASLAGAHPLAAQLPAPAQLGEGWPTYGGDPGGMRFSKSALITRANLSQLRPVWTFHTNALGKYPESYGMPSFETTAVLSGDTLFLTSTYNVVFALDARTGAERWHFDPKLSKSSSGVPFMLASRGVALWPLAAAPQPNAPPCAHRVFLATLDGRLLALDAVTGQLCPAFGDHGSVDLTQGIRFDHIDPYGVTSPPTIVGNVVVVGSAVVDNQQVDSASGAVRGFDAITGKLLWSWEPLPWAEHQKVRTGAGNTWSIISADPALGLVYLPTGSPAPDYYGGMRPGDDRDADSIVALDAATGKKVWAFQVVHHDVWDYDIASEPVLFTWHGSVPAIAVTTKMGMIFLFDRRTGQPLVPVEERPVPQSDVPGEQSSPTQPFQNIPSLAPLTFDLSASSSLNRSPADSALCHTQRAALRYEGLYTPPSLGGSLFYPGNLGGVNWGGAAIDPSTGILYADTNRSAFATRLIPRHSITRALTPFLLWVLPRRKLCLALALLALLLGGIRRRSFYPGWLPVIVALACVSFVVARSIQQSRAPLPTGVKQLAHFSYELSPQRKAPYLIERRPLLDSKGLSCTPTPWGGITAVNLNTLTKVWEKPLGTMVPGQHTGISNFGGPIVTASGLVITGAAEDSALRVFDAATGEELLKLPLPASAASTPMTYTFDGRQYIVIAAGGHGDGFATPADSLIAFAIN